MNAEIFRRNVPGSLEILSKSCVGIAGCGGLGSNGAIALARAGIGRLILADMDAVETSNLNRQHYFLDDVGSPKVEALKDQLLRINSSLLIDSFALEVTSGNAVEMFLQADILIEAFDRAENKQWLISTWSTHFPERPVICGNGIAGIGKTNDLQVTRAGNIYFCGDMKSELSQGLCSARVAIVANMQANVAIDLLVHGGLYNDYR